MENIIEPTIDFDFSKVQLGIPVAHPGSTYVARIFTNNKPFYIQTPKCTTKGGIVKSGKKSYCDLMFSSDESIFIDWVSNLESKCQELICNKSDSWFQTKYTPDEIETAFTSPLKIYKSGKYYLLRANIKPSIKIFNDLNAEVDFETINENTHMITIIEFYGIKFTSSNFQIEVELRQSLVVSPDEFLGNCFIKKSAPSILSSQPIKRYEPIEPDFPPPPVEENLSDNKDNLELIVTEPTNEILKDVAIIETIKNEEIDNPILEETKELSENVAIIPPFNIEENEPMMDNTIIELSEFDFDTSVERLEELEPLHLKRPTDAYYKQYNDMILRANLLKVELKKIYLDASNLKNRYSLNVDNIDTNIYSDVELSEDDEE